MALSSPNHQQRVSPMMFSSSSDEESYEGQGHQHEGGQPITFLSLPEEILLRVVDFCDRPALTALTQTSRRLNSLVRTNFSLDRDLVDLVSLPCELLVTICSFLDRRSLGRFAQTSHRIRSIAYTEGLWAREARNCLATNGLNKEHDAKTTIDPLSARDKVRVGRNWQLANYSETFLLVQNTRYMPRLQLERNHLWVSWGNWIWAHPRNRDGTVERTTTRVLKGHKDDVSRFALKDGIVVSGGRDRAMFGWRADTGEFLFNKRYCHGGEISAIDLVSQSQLVLTGSRDRTVKIWSFQEPPEQQHPADNYNRNRNYYRASPSPLQHATINMQDRIWSLEVNPSGNKVAVGSAGLGGVPALHLLDLATPFAPPTPLGVNLKHGAGILDIKWTSPHTFLTCGYDTSARLWDIRVPTNNNGADTCVRTWVEPFDEVLYCLATDGSHTLMCGTARHGMVRSWDMRSSSPVQMYYTKHVHNGQTSPVYSIGFDQSNLYAALDQCLNVMTFSGLHRDNHRQHHINQQFRNYQAIFDKM